MSNASADSGVVDWEDPQANMYGCLPCPKCGSEYRASYDNGPDAGMICCDDCGFKEQRKERANGK